MFKRKPKKDQESLRRARKITGTSRLHAYYTPVRVDRIDIDLSKSSQRARSFTNASLVGKLQVIAILSFIAFIAYSALILSSTPVISIKGGPTSYTPARYNQAIAAILSDSIFNKTKLTFQKAKIEERIKLEFPEVASVDVAYSFVGKKPEVKMTIFDIPFVYEAAGNAYSVSSEGRNIGEQSEAPAMAKTILIRDESGVSTSKGSLLIRNSDVQFYLKLKELFEAKGRGIEVIKIGVTPREAQLKLTDANYVIKLYLEDDPALQVGTFFASEKTLGEGGLVPTEYIDVRVGEKVFWK